MDGRKVGVVVGDEDRGGVEERVGVGVNEPNVWRLFFYKRETAYMV